MATIFMCGKFWIKVFGYVLLLTLGVLSNLSAQEICDNGIDDDGDGLVDCLDGTCVSFKDCEPCRAASFPLPELFTGWDEKKEELILVGLRDSSWTFSRTRNGTRTPAYVGTCICDPARAWDCGSLPNADWISSGSGCDPQGSNWYHTKFRLDSIIAPYLTLDVEIFADDLIEAVYLNNRILDIQIPNRPSYQSGTSIKLTLPLGFRPGENELTFHILNTGGPGGMALAAFASPDLDKDSVLNIYDVCPFSPGGLPVDAQGCSYFLTQVDTTICSNSPLDWLGRSLVQEGTYLDTLTASIGCDSIVELTLKVQEFEPEILVEDVSCFGDNSGQITVSKSFSGEYDITLFDSSEAQVFLGILENILAIDDLPAGVYQLLIDDKVLCRDTVSLNIDQPPPLGVEIWDLQAVSCFGDKNGAFSVQGIGGSPAYSYSFENLAFGPNNVFEDLQTGTYRVEIKDDKSCTFLTQVFVPQPDSALSVDILLKEDVDCLGNLTGRIELEAFGGTRPYTFHLDLLGRSQPTGLFEGLGAAEYRFRLTDDSACETQVRDTIRTPEGLFVSVDSLQPVACFGENSGFASFKGMGGVPPYQVSLDSLNFLDSLTVVNLPFGTQKIILKDANDCLAATEVFIPQPEKLRTSLISQQNIDCFGNASGKAEVLTKGGIGPYVLTISDRSFTSFTGDTVKIDSLFAGTLRVDISDENGCLDSLFFQLEQPDSLLLQVDTLQAVDCFGYETGKILFSGQGGTSPYTYSSHQIPLTLGKLEDIPAGTYQLKIVDGNSCVTKGEVFVAQPDTLTISVENFSDAFCSMSNGRIELVAHGGTKPYRFIWPSPIQSISELGENIPEGSYVITLSDSNDCSADIRVDIDDTPPPVADFEFSPSPPTLILLSDPLVQFENFSSGAIKGYVWDFGFLNTTTEENPSFRFPKADTFAVSLTVLDPFDSCPQTLSKKVIISPDGFIWIPNVFSPNGDGINDVFQVQFEGLQQFTCFIFDRWGRKIQEFDAPDLVWEGKDASGRDLPEGVYFYQIKTTLNTGEEVVRKGNVSLLR